ncbi:MAG: peptidoglycan-binding protein, partial [Thermoleophilia bacterium]|nr:peptidoglycan-binding protein [Thermoleophilia bacterium]
ERDKRILVAVIGGAVFLLAAGVLVARGLTGSDRGAETTTSTTTTTTPTTTAPTTTTPTTIAPTTLPEGVVLRRGDKSEEVRQVQAVLVELGYSTGSVDAKFGPATEQSVRAFQKASGLAEDGVVGPATLSALSAALNGQ